MFSYLVYFRDTVVYIRVWKTFPRLLYLDERCGSRDLTKYMKMYMRAFVFFSNGKNGTIGNGTIGRQIPFKVLPMVLLVMPLVPMLPTYGSKSCRQNTVWVILPTREKSRDSIWRA